MSISARFESTRVASGGYPRSYSTSATLRMNAVLFVGLALVEVDAVEMLVARGAQLDRLLPEFGR